MNRITRLMVLAIVGMVTLSGFVVQSVKADTSATIGVTAEVGAAPSISVSVCDSNAAFGSNLTPEGGVPTGGDPGVFASSRGTLPGQGIFYAWAPQCGPTIQVTSNVNWQMTICGTENDGPTASPNVNVAGQDLRYFEGTPRVTYDGWLAARAVPLCASPESLGGEFPGQFDIPLALGLRIDVGDSNGTFSSLLTLSAVPT